jgi:RNA polymerase sigma-70 factor, ECF subfamily
MIGGRRSCENEDKARRFREAAVPHLDDVYSLARYLMRGDGADDAVQECYLRALRYFGSYRGPAMKPWLLTILRNVCRAGLIRRRTGAFRELDAETDAEDAIPLWQEAQPAPEARLVREHDLGTMSRLVAELPQALREVIVLREINDLSYEEIATVVDVPVGTVMSRLARATRCRKLRRGTLMAFLRERTHPERIRRVP